MFVWMKENHDVLMVVITFLYVVATIFICYFNWRSTKVSREQIITAHRQQVQNTELQLYSMRKDILNKITKRQYNEVFWDVPLLFDAKISDDFRSIAYEANRLEKLEIVTHSFEEQLRILFPKNKEIIDSQLILAHVKKDYNELEQFIKKTLEKATNKELIVNSVDEYIENLKNVDNINRTIETETLLLVQNLQAFIRNSIK